MGDKIIGTLAIVALICFCMWVFWQILPVILALGGFVLLGALIAWLKNGKSNPDK